MVVWHYREWGKDPTNESSEYKWIPTHAKKNNKKKGKK